MKSVTNNNRIIIGKIGSPHGVKGDFKVYPLTDFPERFSNLKNVYVGDRLFNISYLRIQNKFILMHFENVDNREDAMKLTNQLLKIERKDLMPLSPGEYYAFDIIGLNVFDSKNNSLGMIINILKTGSNDVYVVKDATGKELLVPALKSVVCKIDIDNKVMVIDEEKLEEV